MATDTDTIWNRQLSRTNCMFRILPEVGAELRACPFKACLPYTQLTVASLQEKFPMNRKSLFSTVDIVEKVSLTHLGLSNSLVVFESNSNKVGCGFQAANLKVPMLNFSLVLGNSIVRHFTLHNSDSAAD